jgi:hypothetical protein
MNDNGIAAVFGSGMVEDCPLWVIQSPTATMECSRDGRRSLLAFVGLERVSRACGPVGFAASYHLSSEGK